MTTRFRRALSPSWTVLVGAILVSACEITLSLPGSDEEEAATPAASTTPTSDSTGASTDSSVDLFNTAKPWELDGSSDTQASTAADTATSEEVAASLPPPEPLPQVNPTPAISGGACTSDEECAEGYGCCLAQQRCYARVSIGEICDCQHPCDPTQVCSPGTCGATPARCRPGCFPGAGATDPKKVDPAKGPDSCLDQIKEGSKPKVALPAYCSPLPEEAVTKENKGGACRTSDGCSVALQDCQPDLLLRDMASGPSNPLVEYSCQPVAKTIDGQDMTACFPAGTLKLGEECERRACGDEIESACGKGAVCAKGSSGTYICKQQCTTIGDDDGCPSGTRCGAFLPSWGKVSYTTGVCDQPGRTLSP